MRKIFYKIQITLMMVIGLATTSSFAQCLDWQNPSPTSAWVDYNNEFGGAPCDDGTGCPFNELQAFEVFASEAYALDNVIQGGSYQLSICNGPNAGSWVPEFTIIAPSGAVDAFGPGDGDGCTISWTASEAGTYILVLNEAGQCGGGTNTATPNGFLAVTCTGGAVCATACEAGNFLAPGTANLCFGDITEANTAPSAIPTGGGHGLLFTNFQGGTGAIPGGFTLTGVGENFEIDHDLGGLLSANGLDYFGGTWVVYSTVYADPNNSVQSICSVATDSLVINFSDLFSVNAINNNDGSANAVANAANPSNTYLWSNGQTTQTATGFADGTVATVTVTDALGCTVSDNVTIQIGGTAVPCEDWLNPTPASGWTDFNSTFGGAPCDDGTGCPFNEIQAFEVFASEAYSVNNFIAGGTYAFSMCNGAGAGTWVPEFTIYAPSGAIDAFGPGDGDGCTITWTATESGTYLIVINEAGNCGGGSNIAVNNGFPALTCLGGASCATTCEAGNLLSSGSESLCVGDSIEIISAASTLPTGGNHGIFFSNAAGGTGALDANFILTAVGDTFVIDSDLGGILSGNNLPEFSGTWVIYSAVYSDPNDAFGSICSLSTDSLTLNFSDFQSVGIVVNGNGSATATPGDGVSPYTYAWSNGQTTSTTTNLPTGTYTVTVTDAFGCTATASTSVVSSVKTIESLKSLAVSPNPTNGKFEVRVALDHAQAMEVKILDVTGKEIIKEKGFAAEQNFSFNLSAQPAGVYFVKTTVGDGTTVNRLVLTK